MKRAALSSILAAILAASALGCAATPTARLPGSAPILGTLAAHRGTAVGERFTVSTREVTSPTMHLERTSGGFEGYVQHTPLDLHAEGDALVGQIGGSPIRLRVEHRDGLVAVSGLWAGGHAAFRLSRTGLARCGEGGAIEPSPRADACDADSAVVSALMASTTDEDAAALLSLVLLSAPEWSPAPPSGQAHVDPTPARASAVARPAAPAKADRSRG